MIYSEIKDCKKILPRKGCILGLDIGTKKIGVAICDDSQKIATPKKIIKRQSNAKDFATLLSIIQENDIVALVLGFPLKMDGSESLMSNFVMRFAINLEKFLHDLKIEDLVLIVFDERLSSYEARSMRVTKSAKNKDYDDISASLILENFINCLHEGKN